MVTSMVSCLFESEKGIALQLEWKAINGIFKLSEIFLVIADAFPML